MKVLVIVFLLGILYGPTASSILASTELRSLLDTTAAQIDTLDDKPFPKATSRVPFLFGEDCIDRLDCRRDLLRLQLYSGDMDGAVQSLSAIQKEVDSLKNTERQNTYRVFIVNSLGRLHHYQDAGIELEKIAKPTSKIQAAIQLLEIYVTDIEPEGLDMLSLVQYSLKTAVAENRPDFEARLYAIEGVVLAKAGKTYDAKTSVQNAYDALTRAVKLAEQNDKLVTKTKTRMGTTVKIPDGIFVHNKAQTEQRLLDTVMRHQVMAGLHDDAFDVYRNYVFLTDSLREEPWNRFSLMDTIVRTLVELGKIDSAIALVKKDDKMDDASAPSMLIADALSKEGKIKEVFDLLDIPQFKGQQATAGIVNIAIGIDSPEVITQLNTRFPGMGFDKIFRMRGCAKLIEADKWDEAMALVKTFEKEGEDVFMFPSTQGGILKSIAFSEWKNGNFDRANEAITIIRTETQQEQIKNLRSEFSEAEKFLIQKSVHTLFEKSITNSSPCRILTVNIKPPWLC